MRRPVEPDPESIADESIANEPIANEPQVIDTIDEPVHSDPVNSDPVPHGPATADDSDTAAMAADSDPLESAPAPSSRFPSGAPVPAVALQARPQSMPLTARAPAQAPRLIERRKFRRDAMATQALVRLDSLHGPPAKVLLLDLSVAGVRFRSTTPFDVGDKAQIRLEVGPLRWTTRMRIVHCERGEQSTHTIGCAFLRTELLKPWPATAA